MDEHIRRLRLELLTQAYFDEINAQAIVDWLIASEKRRPVVLVGAGFSRNALHGTRRDFAKPEEVPLWPDLNRRLAQDLGVEPNSYDALTMAEMHGETFGNSGLRDAMLALLPDDELQPGPAHAALAEYEVEAIITTNLLDTLLDDARHPGYAIRPTNPVIRDIDLSRRMASTTSARDLIYLHGHRSQFDTWVLTRTQYEDVPTKKPVMLTRVRQLFAQHPLLVIGFGLADPHFHKVYRQLAGEMRFHQPLALAIQLGEPASLAEVRHWMSLGVRVATPRKGASIARAPAESTAFFSWLFRQIPTTWSPDDRAVLEYAVKPEAPEERLSRLRRLLPLRAPSPGRNYHEQQSAEFRAWRKVLFSILTDADHQHARSRTQQGAAWERSESAKRDGRTAVRDAAPAAQAPVQTERPSFAALPEWPDFRVNDINAWLLDGVLSHMTSAQETLLEYLELALERGLFRAEAAELEYVPWIPLTFRIAATLHLERPALLDLARRCIGEALRYGDDQWVDLIRREATTCGLEIPAEETIAADGPGVSDALRGFGALLNADAAVAQLAYSSAAAQARAASLEFEEWVYTKGELASFAMMQGDSPEPADASDSAERNERRENSQRRLIALESSQVVASWRERAQVRIQQHLDEVAERAESRMFRREGGGWAMFGSNRAHMVWRSFRDLERIGAPPHLLHEHLLPVLRGAPLPDELEFSLRLRLGVEKTASWLNHVIASRTVDLDEQRARDAGIVGVFFAEQATVTERLARLDVFVPLVTALAANESDRAATWLADARRSFLAEVSTYARTRFMSREFPAALGALAGVRPAAEVLGLLREWWERGDGEERDDLARVAARLPWHRWTRQTPDAVVEWIRWALGDEGDVARLNLAFAVLEATSQLAHARDGSLPMLGEFLRSYTERIYRRRLPADAYRAAYMLERRLNEAAFGPEASGLLQRWLPKIDLSEASARRPDGRWLLLADSVDFGASPTDVHDGLLRQLEGDCVAVVSGGHAEKTDTFYAANPRRSGPLVRMLAASVRCLPAQRRAAIPKLLGLLRVDSAGLEYLAPMLSESVWGDHWEDVLLIVSRAAAGAGPAQRALIERGDDGAGLPTERQIAAIDLFAAIMRNRRSSMERPPEETRLVANLRPVMIALSQDERALVANRASFAIANGAELAVDDHEQAVYASALHEIAVDTRAVVRMAGAYAAGRLPTLARGGAVAAAARELATIMCDDTNARVRVLGDQGRAEATTEAPNT